MNTLTSEQIDAFDQSGCLVIDNALTSEQLSNLIADFETWVDDSRQFDNSYGETLDGRPRFDIEPGHTAESPALRRVASPIDISAHYLKAMRSNGALDAITQLISPNIKFHHCKINSKLPGAATQVKFHQDFTFEPHSNDDLVTVLFFLDEVTNENGPLEVVPGSHKGPLHSLWHDGVFTGAVAGHVEEAIKSQTVKVTGKAGSACLMHTRLLHGSAPNLSRQPRTLFIGVYSNDDAVPLSPNPLPTHFAGELVAGIRTNRVRCVDYDMAIPEVPSGASFFNQQVKS